MLILVRHGQSEANAAGLLVGRTDSALTALGRRQAERIGEALVAGHTGQPVRIITSPLSRARHTAAIVAAAYGGAEPEVEERLIELDYGGLEGQRPAELARGV